MTDMNVHRSGDLAFPKSLPEFQRLFPDDAACADYLERARWGDSLGEFAQTDQKSHRITALPQPPNPGFGLTADPDPNSAAITS
jgi:hypothetical protein